MSDPTARFSTRVRNYVRYRPGYPEAVIDLLRDEFGLRAATVVADVGSGTGILTERFIANGNTVYAIEPNLEMRAAAEQLLGRHATFRSVDGRAEATTLEHDSVDLVTAGQAFHWFDREAARREFRRILRPPGRVALLWNERDTTATPFLRAYEELLVRRARDYAEVDHRRMDAGILGAFFGHGGYREAVFPNRQEFDFEGLRGRLLSSSYVPEAGEPGHEEMLASLLDIFERHEAGGRVAFEYHTRVYLGLIERGSPGNVGTSCRGREG